MNVTSFYVEFCLEIAQDMPEIYMEKFTVFLNHNVSWVPVSNTQNVCGDQVSDTRS